MDGYEPMLWGSTHANVVNLDQSKGSVRDPLTAAACNLDRADAGLEVEYRGTDNEKGSPNYCRSDDGSRVAISSQHWVALPVN